MRFCQGNSHWSLVIGQGFWVLGSGFWGLGIGDSISVRDILLYNLTNNLRSLSGLCGLCVRFFFESVQSV